MYYNRVTQRIDMDSVDRFIIYCMISIYVTNRVQSYFSEKKKMERLRQDLIRQSKTLDSTSPARVPVLSKSKPVSTPSTLYIRGGQLQNIKKLMLFRKVFTKVKMLIVKLWVMLDTPHRLNQPTNIVLTLLRYNLFYILKLWRVIQFPTFQGTTFYLDKTEIVKTSAAILTGPILAWLGVAATLSLEILGVTLAVKSSIEQYLHNELYNNFHEEILNDIHEDIRKLRFSNDKMFHEIKKVEYMVSNEPKLNLSDSTLEPEMERIAERLGIAKDIIKQYDSKANINEIIKDSTLGEIEKESPVGKLLTLYQRMKEKVIKKRYKTFQDLLKNVEEGAQLIDEYEEYITPIEVKVPPIKVK